MTSPSRSTATAAPTRLNGRRLVPSSVPVVLRPSTHSVRGDPPPTPVHGVGTYVSAGKFAGEVGAPVAEIPPPPTMESPGAASRGAPPPVMLLWKQEHV